MDTALLVLAVVGVFIGLMALVIAAVQLGVMLRDR